MELPSDSEWEPQKDTPFSSVFLGNIKTVSSAEINQNVNYKNHYFLSVKQLIQEFPKYSEAGSKLIEDTGLQIYYIYCDF